MLRDLIGSNEPTVGKLLDENGIEISLITVNWFLTSYSNVAPLYVYMILAHEHSHMHTHIRTRAYAHAHVHAHAQTVNIIGVLLF